MAEQAREPVDNRESKTQALVAVAFGIVELDKFAEDLFLLVLRNANAGGSPGEFGL
jgi:hypothetical protein